MAPSGTSATIVDGVTGGVTSGAVDRTAVYDAADRATRQLRREVNPTVMSVPPAP